MTFEIHSDITNRSMTVAARAMRKALRRKRSIIWAIFGWTVFFINALLLIPFDGEPFALDVRTVTSLLVEVMLLSVLLFQDRFNGMIARKNALAGTKAVSYTHLQEALTLYRIILRWDELGSLTTEDDEERQLLWDLSLSLIHICYSVISSAISGKRTTFPPPPAAPAGRRTHTVPRRRRQSADYRWRGG